MTRLRTYLQHVGASPHMRHIHNDAYSDGWVGGGNSLGWSSSPPHLIPLDHHLWSHMKSLVYKENTNKRDAKLCRILNATEQIWYTDYILERTIGLIIKRVRNCIKVEGAQFDKMFHI
jgi:hypothetical protein